MIYRSWFAYGFFLRLGYRKGTKSHRKKHEFMDYVVIYSVTVLRLQYQLAKKWEKRFRVVLKVVEVEIFLETFSNLHPGEESAMGSYGLLSKATFLTLF